MLWIVTFALATPLMFRSLFDALSLTKKWDHYFSDKTILYNTVFFIVVDLFPILTQTSTLIFGVIRHRQQSQTANQPQHYSQVVRDEISSRDSQYSDQLSAREVVEFDTQTSSQSTFQQLEAEISYFEPPLQNQQLLSAQFIVRRVLQYEYKPRRDNSNYIASQEGSLNQETPLSMGEVPDDYGFMY